METQEINLIIVEDKKETAKGPEVAVGVTNLFIVDDDRLMITELKHCLEKRFGVSIRISTFNDGESCLQKVDKDTNIVILDYFLNGKSGLEVLKLIKEINPKTEVIMFSCNEDVITAIETFKAGAKDYVVKGQGSWKKLIKIVNYIITEPIRIMVREFGVTKYMAIFLLIFVTMALMIFFALYMMKK